MLKEINAQFAQGCDLRFFADFKNNFNQIREP